MIYVIEEDESSMVKIGSTRSSDALKLRLIKLNEGNPRRLRAVALAVGDRREESRLHFVFDSEWQRGEWFRRGPLVSAYIARHIIEPITVKDNWPADETCPFAFAKARKELAAHALKMRQLKVAEETRRAQALAQAKAEDQRRREVYTCTRCGTKGHTAPSCKAVIQVAQSLSLSPFTVAARRVRESSWKAEDRDEWRRWFASRQKSRRLTG